MLQSCTSPFAAICSFSSSPLPTMDPALERKMLGSLRGRPPSCAKKRQPGSLAPVSSHLAASHSCPWERRSTESPLSGPYLTACCVCGAKSLRTDRSLRTPIFSLAFKVYVLPPRCGCLSVLQNTNTVSTLYSITVFAYYLHTKNECLDQSLNT